MEHVRVYGKKEIWRTRCNNETVYVKATFEEMETLYNAEKISDYTLATVYTPKELKN